MFKKMKPQYQNVSDTHAHSGELDEIRVRVSDLGPTTLGPLVFRKHG